MKKIFFHKTMLLLDTHIWLWFFLGKEEKLSPNEMEQINTALQNNELYISIFSTWEVFQLEEKKRIIFPTDLKKWVNECISKYNINILPISVDIAWKSNHLENFHKDPADRIIVASSVLHEIPLMTHDKKILAFNELQQ